MLRSPLALLTLAGMLAAPPSNAQDVVGDCADLPDRLAACEAYECTFAHPFTGGEESRSVKGPDGEQCLYHETMPGDGAMDCSYDEASRVRVADYYRAWFTTGNPPADGGNPLNDALADGSCKVSGY